MRQRKALRPNLILIHMLKNLKRKKRPKKSIINLRFIIYKLIQKYILFIYIYCSKKRAKSEDGEIHDSNEDELGKSHPLVSVTKIDPDEIPEVPANKFLYRAGPTNNANQKEFRQHYGRDRVRSHRKTGRIFKGRGIFVSICVQYTTYGMYEFLNKFLMKH